MKTILLVGLLLIAAADSFGSEIELRAIHELRHPSMAAGVSSSTVDEFQNLTVWIYVKNLSSETIRVPTEVAAMIQFTSRENRRRLNIQLDWNFPENPLGIKTAIADSKLGIVNIEHDETAMLVIKTRIEEREVEEISVNYQVAEGLAKKLQLWSGSVSTLSSRH